MNIDFHYGVIYIIARVAGLSQQDAEVVAHACQYVDDSTMPGVLKFAGGESYDRFASAHGMLDYRNQLNDLDKLVWAPFHFLPGGQGDTLEERTRCVANSEIAKEMVRNAISIENDGNRLHRLGITLHVYVDTWAHQHFSGTISKFNVVRKLKSQDHTQKNILSTMKNLFSEVKDGIESEFVDLFSKLGHGAALHLPDLPWAIWEYEDGYGKLVKRENLPIFIDAAHWAHRAICGFMKHNVAFETESALPDDVAKALEKLFDTNRSNDEKERLDFLDKALSVGEVPRLQEKLPIYVSKGPGSWKEAATGIIDKVGDAGAEPSWSTVFEESHYRKFHDAIKEHRFDVMQTILPKHGIRLA